jgi:hypothetical protein
MAREIIEILETVEDEGGNIGQRTAGRFILEDGKLTAEPATPDDALMMARILADPIPIKEGTLEVSSTDQPVLWFHSLSRFLSGTYLNALTVHRCLHY